MLRAHSWRGLGHPNLEATTRTARGHGHFSRTPPFPCRSDLLLWDLNFCRRTDICSQVSQPAQSHLQHVFSPQLPRLRTPSEDRQGAGAAETCLGGLCPLPASRQDFLPRTLCLPFPNPGLTCRSKLSSLPLCAVFQEGEWGEEAAAQLKPGGGGGSDHSVTSF